MGKKDDGQTATITTENATVTSGGHVPPPDPFGEIRFNSLPIQHAQRLLGAFVRHVAPCQPTAETGCTCGLRSAIEELLRIDQIGNRYGFSE
jgi:hypothetical protein